MLAVCIDPNMSVFSQSLPMENDTLALKIVLGDAEKDNDNLVDLGMLKDITADHLEQVEKANADSGRTWKVFEITALGRAMFQAYTNPTVQ
jgi:hypothetical protein